MNLILIAVGLGVSVVITAMVRRRRGHGRQSDLGFVSDQWVAEHRLSQQHDASR